MWFVSRFKRKCLDQQQYQTEAMSDVVTKNRHYVKKAEESPSTKSSTCTYMFKVYIVALSRPNVVTNQIRMKL